MNTEKPRVQIRADYQDSELVFYGEIGCIRRVPHLVEDGVLADDYDHDNPDGGEYTRRNYDETCYLSGVPELEPGEYQWHLGTHYGEYRFSDRSPEVSAESPSDPTRPAGRRPGS